LLLGAIAFYYVGYNIAYHKQPALLDKIGFDYSLWFLQFSYSTTAATIDSGALAGRVSFMAYLALSLIMNSLIYPAVVHWAWGGGWLQNAGFIDFAGGSVVHLVGAASAFVCVCVCGPRIGRFEHYKTWRGCLRLFCAERNSDQYYQGPITDVEKRIFQKCSPLHNPVQVLFGLFLLICGFLAFNPASTLATTDNTDLVAGRATVGTLMAASGGALSSFPIALLHRGDLKIAIPEFATAVIAGLVASCAGCHVVPATLCLLVGFIGGLLSDCTQTILTRFRFDDPVGAVAAHGPPGIWGVISVALFAAPNCQSDLRGLAFGGGSAAWNLLWIQAYGVAFIVAFSLGATYVTVISIDLLCGFRSNRATELIGHDFMEHAFEDGSFTGNPLVHEMTETAPVRDCLKERIKRLHSPVKQYQEPSAIPPTSETSVIQEIKTDNESEIKSLKEELKSLKEDMRIMSTALQRRQVDHSIFALPGKRNPQDVSAIIDELAVSKPMSDLVERPPDLDGFDAI